MLEAGSGPDSKPQRGQNVTITLKTTLSDGTTVADESSISFTLGDGDVIQVRSSECLFCLLYVLFIY